jgi:ABC-2 type transport system permease protein
MITYLRIESRKLIYSNTFWIITGLHALFLIVAITGAEAFINKSLQNAQNSSPTGIPLVSLYTFPYVWHNVAYLSGFLKIFMAFLVIIFTTAEFSYKTIRQHIIFGMGRTSFFVSKFLMVVVIGFYLTLLTALVTFLLGISHTESLNWSVVYDKSWFLAAYFLEVLTFLVFALFVALLLRKTGLSLIVFAAYVYIGEPILRSIIGEPVSSYLPAKVISNLIVAPNTALLELFGVSFRESVRLYDVLLSLSYLVLFIILSILLIKKRDL